MIILKIISLLFAGYLIGRIGDYFGGHINFFHHWIYGVILIVVGLIFNINIFVFGIGLTISDLKDMVNFEIFGPDKKTKKNFWGID